MRRQVFLLIFIVGFQFLSYGQVYEIQDNIKRIVFIGNSITYAGKYIEYIETYMTLQHPDKEYNFINVGLPSETVSGLSELNHANGAFPRPDLHDRLDRLLAKTKPDLVFSCYGMNDGIYLPFDNIRFEKYKEGIDWLDEEVKKSGAEIIHITPPIYDNRKGEAYANVLDIYSDWLISKRYTDNWQVIDIHWPMKKYLEDQRLIDSTFALARDGVHPNELGHFLIAKHMLSYLGETELLTENDFNSFLSRFQNGSSILNQVEQKQKIMKDAWLTLIGHKRPRMDIGLTMPEAERNTSEIETQIRNLLKKK